jgi:hypothetical protein
VLSNILSLLLTTGYFIGIKLVKVTETLATQVRSQKSNGNNLALVGLQRQLHPQ